MANFTREHIYFPNNLYLIHQAAVTVCCLCVNIIDKLLTNFGKQIACNSVTESQPVARLNIETPL